MHSHYEVNISSERLNYMRKSCLLNCW